jgi:hypothetical protein
MTPTAAEIAAAATATEPPPAPSCPAAFAMRQGDHLVADGQTFAFFGVNAEFLLSPPFPKEQMEPELADLAQRGVNTVRMWFFYDYDPERLQAALDLGARYGIRFVVVLGDDVNKGQDWFFGDEDDNVYRPHLVRTVQRFAPRAEILAWEPMNEPNCGGNYSDACLKTIRDWLTMASELVTASDPCHLVSSGLIGAGNYPEERDAYRRIHQRDSITLLSVHRKSTGDDSEERAIAEELNKPIFAGEIYDVAYTDGCQPLDGGAELKRRAERVKDDLRKSIRRGLDGYLLWDYAPGRVEVDHAYRDYCSKFGFERDDPLWANLAQSGVVAPVPWRPQG